MTARKRESSREGARKLAAEIAGTDYTPLAVLLRMMRDPAIGSSDRMEIAKICLPFVHPRIAQFHPPETGPDDNPVDICDPAYVRELIRILAFSLSTSARKGQEIPGHIWDLLKYIPRGPSDLKTPASNNASTVPRR